MDLGAKVSRSITQLIKHSPAIGWVRADQIAEDRSKEILELRQQVEELHEKLRKVGLERPANAEKLAQGNDTFLIDFSYVTRVPKQSKSGQTYYVKGKECDGKLETSWDDVFAYLAPKLINHLYEHIIISKINTFIVYTTINELESDNQGCRIENIIIYSSSFDKIKIQLRALGLIEINEENDWTLTPYGENYMNLILASMKDDSIANTDSME